MRDHIHRRCTEPRLGNRTRPRDQIGMRLGCPTQARNLRRLRMWVVRCIADSLHRIGPFRRKAGRPAIQKKTLSEGSRRIGDVNRVWSPAARRRGVSRSGIGSVSILLGALYSKFLDLKHREPMLAFDSLDVPLSPLRLLFGPHRFALDTHDHRSANEKPLIEIGMLSLGNIRNVVWCIDSGR